jgi:hypothetical protein
MRTYKLVIVRRAIVQGTRTSYARPTRERYCIFLVVGRVNQFAVPAALRLKSSAMEERIPVPLDQGSFCEDEFYLGARVIGPAKIEESAHLVKDIANRHSIPKQSLECGLWCEMLRLSEGSQLSAARIGYGGPPTLHIPVIERPRDFGNCCRLCSTTDSAPRSASVHVILKRFAGNS